ncbi:MAG: asparagine synthase-related protein, partial [Anaerolineae bacterium]
HEFLRGSYRRWVCQTVYEDIQRLPPAHYLAVDGGVHKPRLYYALGSGTTPQCASDEDWLQAFRELFQEAVRCRLRSITPIGISVSGGLDSSSVACMAHALAQQREDLPEIRLYSLVYRETPGADESQYLDAVAKHCTRFVTIKIDGDEFWALREFGSDGGFPLDEPEIYPLRSQTLAPLRRAAVDGCRVVLSGDGGDHVLAQNLYAEPRGLRGLAGRDWFKEVRYFRMATHISWFSLLCRAYLMPLVPSKILPMLETLYIGFVGRQSWLNGRSWHYGWGACSLEGAFLDPPRLKPHAQVIHGNLRFSRESARLSALDLSAAYAGVDYRHPFFDHRLIDLLLRMPQHLIAWRGVDRIIVRKSFFAIMPDAVRVRCDKCHFEGLVRRGLAKEQQRIDELLRDSKAEALGFVRVERLRDMIRNDWQQQTGFYGDMLRLLCIEAWLRGKTVLDEQKED